MNAFGKKAAANQPRASSSGRAAQKEDTRRRILAVARAHFERHGFEQSNVRAIADDANVVAGTVLLHFRDKHDLLHAALFDDLAHVIDEQLSAAPRRTAKPPTLEVRLRTLARAFFTYYAARPKLSKTLLREALLAESPWRERFVEQVARVHAYVVRLASEAKARGELRADLDTALFGAAFFSFYYFALIGWVQGGFSDPAPVFERLLAEHLSGAASRVTARRKRK